MDELYFEIKENKYVRNDKRDNRRTDTQTLRRDNVPMMHTTYCDGFVFTNELKKKVLTCYY